MVSPVKNGETLNRVLMVAPWGKDRENQDFLHPNLGLYRIKTYLNEYGIECEVFDPNLSLDPYFDLKKLVDGNNFQLVGFSTNHITLPYDLSLLHWLYESGREPFLMVGGIEAALNYRQVLKYSPEGVMVVRGEGEPVILEFCCNPKPEDVPGIIWMEDDEYHYSEKRSQLNYPLFLHLIQNFSWDDIPFQHYWKLNSKLNSHMSSEEIHTVRLVLSNYCPRGCYFCSSTNFLRESAGKPCKIHRVSPENVIDVLLNIYNAYPEVETIFFHDDDFLDNRNWAKDTCDIIQDSKNQGKIPLEWEFIAQGGVRNVPHLSKRLALTGFRLIGLGVESFSPNVLKEFHKNQSPKEVKSAVKTLLNYDIVPYINLILSSPHTKWKDLKMTIKNSINYLRQGALIAASLYPLAYPGAKMVNKAKEKGLVTYKNYKIPRTDLKIPLTDKILPHDRDMVKLLKRTEEKLSLNLKRFSMKKTIRAYTGPVILHTILQEAQKMGLDDCKEKASDLELLICSQD